MEKLKEKLQEGVFILVDLHHRRIQVTGVSHIISITKMCCEQYHYQIIPNSTDFTQTREENIICTKQWVEFVSFLWTNNWVNYPSDLWVVLRPRRAQLFPEFVLLISPFKNTYICQIFNEQRPRRRLSAVGLASHICFVIITKNNNFWSQNTLIHHRNTTTSSRTKIMLS